MFVYKKEDTNSVGETEDQEDSVITLNSDGDESNIASRSERDRIPNKRLQNYVTYVCKGETHIDDKPISVKEAPSRPDETKR